MSRLTDFTQLKQNHAETLSWLAGQQSEMERLVIKWAEVNSGSGNLDGLLAMEDLIIKFDDDFHDGFSTKPLEPETRVGKDGQPFVLEPRRSLYFNNGIQSSRKVLMTGHTDTVFPKSSAFQTVKKLSNGQFNGPGVTDMKGGILVMLFALMGLRKAGLMDRVTIEMLLSPDEETGSIGSAPLLAEHARQADIGLTYEPALADGTLAGARKGSGNYHLVVKGKAAHAGREFFVGKNAVVKLAQITADLAALTNARPNMTLNAAVVEGGVAPNIVPDLAMLKFNIRLDQENDAEFAQAAIDNVLKAHQEDGFEISLFGGINRPPKNISAVNKLLMDRVADLGSALDLDIRYVPTGGCCEGNNLAAEGLPNIDTLGVRGGNIHSEDEFLCPESLSERARLSFLILAGIAEGQFDDIIEQRGRTAA